MSRASATKAGQPILTFGNSASFRAWLELNHADHPGIWMKIAKKGSGIPSVTYAEALDQALCYGWIDGQKQGCDAQFFLQKFTRRGPRSLWSQINTGHIARLSQAGLMHPAGLAAVDAAKADGRWQSAYAGFASSEMPSDFLKQLAKNKKAAAFYATLNKTNRYSLYFRITTAKKPATRQKRITDLIAMLQRGEKFH